MHQALEKWMTITMKNLYNIIKFFSYRERVDQIFQGTQGLGM
jgi:hypothetical protein